MERKQLQALAAQLCPVQLQYARSVRSVGVGNVVVVYHVTIVAMDMGG